MQPLKDFAKTLPAARSASGRRQSPTCSPSVASESARRLLGCYRKGEAEDAEIYVGALAVVLESYPAHVAQLVTDPRTGIAGKSQFLPTVAEVRHACELEMKPIRDEAARLRRRAESEANMRGADEERAKRKTFAELADAYPAVIGTRERCKPSPAEQAALLADLESRKPYLASPLTVSELLEGKVKGRTEEGQP